MTGSLATCQEMISSGHSLSEQLRDKMKQVQNKWNLLKEEVRRRDSNIAEVIFDIAIQMCRSRKRNRPSMLQLKRSSFSPTAMKRNPSSKSL